MPFCWESKLSGIHQPDYLGQAWYQRSFSIPEKWDRKAVFLCFGAVDWQCRVWINGKEAGSHTGGYNAFEFDITDDIKPGENTLTVWVEDDVSAHSEKPALIGKQGYDAPCGYAHTSGIWQTVWLEARNHTSLNSARFSSDIDRNLVKINLKIHSEKDQELYLAYDFKSKLYHLKADKDKATGSEIHVKQKVSLDAGNQTINKCIKIKNPQLWSCKRPVLYDGTLKLLDQSGKPIDEVSTYFGMRKISTDYYGSQKKVKYVFLNNKPIYLSGVLDQGFWEDGIYTAPSEAALKQDVVNIKRAGFNYMRKHMKVEDPLQYYWCDKLGIMVMQDIPWGTGMVPKASGAQAKGREYFETCMRDTLKTDFNHPSLFSLILFNETWGLADAYNHNNRFVKASDGMNTKEWVAYLYKKARKLDPNILVEDMSACNDDHVQPTDLNSYHMYPKTFADGKARTTDRDRHAYVGSTNNFAFGNKQDGDPLINSEYGGVAAKDGDYDISYCFKWLTDIQRQAVNQSGLLYTEPYDVAYERNGLYTYDRRKKEMGYKAIAYGNDMTTADLVGDVYVGFSDEAPIRTVKPGRPMRAEITAIAWKEDLPEKITMKWRYDATDENGRRFDTAISGCQTITLKPYEQTRTSIYYFAPFQNCVGTMTVWLEDENGHKIAKNFTNVVVKGGNPKTVQTGRHNALIMRHETNGNNMDSVETSGSVTYDYTLPSDFSLKAIKNMQVLAELSACKTATNANPNTSAYHSAYSQTAKGRETPSDITVSVNGVEIGTRTVADDPRDMRGTLSLLQPLNGGSSAGDFGYLVKMDMTDGQVKKIKATMKTGKKLSLRFEVKDNAAHKNGLRVYSSHYGRYMLSPQIRINQKSESSMSYATKMILFTAAATLILMALLFLAVMLCTRQRKSK